MEQALHRKVIAFLLAGIALAPACTKKRTPDTSSVRQGTVSDEDVRAHLAKNKIIQVNVTSGATPSYSWTFDKDACGSKEGLMRFLEGATSGSRINSGFKSTRDFPAGAGVGGGFYVAGDPFVSHTFGNKLISVNLKPGILALVQAHDSLPGDKTILPAVLSPALGVVYNWRPGPQTDWAVVYRQGSVDVAIDGSTARCYDFSTGRLLRDLEMKPLTAASGPEEFIERFGAYAPLFAGAMGRNKIDDFHYRLALASEMVAAPKELRERFAALPGAVRSGAECAKDAADPVGKCLEEVAMLFMGNVRSHDRGVTSG